jgi:hypothetical protein
MRLPDSKEVGDLKEQCLAIEDTVKQWARQEPSPEEREALMRKVLALHVAITRLRRRSRPPPT